MQRNPRLAAVLLCAALAACGGGGTSADASPIATSSVSLPRSYRFEPATITVPAQTTVTWTNADNFTHTVRLKTTGQVIGQMAPGESVRWTFATPGLVPYDCSLHPTDMQGSVLVVDAES